MTTTTERRTGIPTIEGLKTQCSASGKRLLESAEYFARRFRHDKVEVSDIAYALFWNTTIQEELKNVNIGSLYALESFVEIIKSGRKKHKPIGSIQDIFIVADEDRVRAGSSKIRAGDILMAIYNSPTEAGEVLKEALLSVANNEKGVGLSFAFRASINRVEKPWAA